MGRSDDHVRRQNEDRERTLDAGRPLHEIGSRIGGCKPLSILGEGGRAAGSARQTLGLAIMP